MKKTLFILPVLFVAVALLAFSWNKQPAYDGLLDDVRQQEYLSTTTSAQLKVTLLDLFGHDFETISQVDIHQDQAGNYYYVAYGYKAGKPSLKLLNAEPEMVASEYFPTRQELGLAPQLAIIECYCQDDGSCSHDRPDRGEEQEEEEEPIICGEATDTMMRCTITATCPKVKKFPIDFLPFGNE